jgi:hypothetical protein
MVSSWKIAPSPRNPCSSRNALQYHGPHLLHICMYLWWEGGRNNGLIGQYYTLAEGRWLLRACWGYIGHCRRLFQAAKWLGSRTSKPNSNPFLMQRQANRQLVFEMSLTNTSSPPLSGLGRAFPPDCTAASQTRSAP